GSRARIVRSSGDTAIVRLRNELIWDQVLPSSNDAYTPSYAAANTRLEDPDTMSTNPDGTGVRMRSHVSPPSLDRTRPPKVGTSSVPAAVMAPSGCDPSGI